MSSRARPSAASQSAAIFDSTANTGPKSNLPSYGPEAYSAAQIGGQVTLPGFQAEAQQRHRHAQQLGMRGQVTGTRHCVTPAGAKYSLPITLNIYNTTDGTLLTSKTQTFDVSYRPSANPAKCTGAPTKWYSTTEKKCFNGLAQDVTFTFDGTTTLPDTVRYGIAYGTSHYGSPSIGDRPARDCGRLLLRLAERRLTDGFRASAPARARCSSTPLDVPILADTGYTPAVQFKAGS